MSDAMLCELHVENLGIIANVTVPVGMGLVAVTGETGAGKTMLISALQLLAGGRADGSLVRHGESEARIDGRFVDGDEEWVLTRVIPADGRSRGYINGRPATASELAALASQLVDLHGQHAQQSLLQPSAQRALLDAFGGHAEVLATYRGTRADLQACLVERDALGGDPHARARELELLLYQAREIDDAALLPNEDAALEREEELLANAVQHQEALGKAYDALQEQASDALGVTSAALTGPFAELGERARVLQAEATDLAADIRHTLDGVVVDPERLDEVRRRRHLVRDLQRKYGDTVDAVLTYRGELAEQIARLEDFDTRAAGIDVAVAAAEARCREAAGHLTKARTASAVAFSAAITDRLPELAMPNAAFTIAIAPGALGDDGADDVTFMLAANAGEPARPLAKTASGGELSRAMLAIRVVLADREALVGGPATLVFDEVDAGIGGEAGLAIGRALAALSRDRQVLCVTHLGQVAACASTQLVVSKRESDGRTIGEVALVLDDARVSELARMLGGVDSDSARVHARELLVDAEDARA